MSVYAMGVAALHPSYRLRFSIGNDEFMMIRQPRPVVRCPTGKSGRVLIVRCPASHSKIFCFAFTQIKFRFPPSCLPEGRFAIVTNVRRDAVDVDALLTDGAEADGEVVWS
jgi:hypothetical protein